MTDWLKAQIFADRTRLGLIGFSLGGLLASCVCGRTNAYSAAVLIAPTTPENLCRHAAEASAEQPVIYGPHTLHPQLFEDIMTLNPLADITKNPRPTLVVHGTADKAVTPGVVEQFINAMQEGGLPAEVQMIDQAGHSFAHPTWRQQLKEGVVAWLSQQLV
jgi:dipeptidyl aminopeptidase/acylaminoacyl peptidase